MTIIELQHVALEAIGSALKILSGFDRSSALEITSLSTPKEIKTNIDVILESSICSVLRTTGLDIITEEREFEAGSDPSHLEWIVDPLDGTVNYARNIGPCGVSIALCENRQPIWGVIGEFPSGSVSWGGKYYGAFRDGVPLRVSNTKTKAQAIICSGFPSRFTFDQKGYDWIRETFEDFAKVRMLGAASLSLLAVANGSVDAYSEMGIRIWDVAAGLAIVEGAGGRYQKSSADHGKSYDVFAHNDSIFGVK